jgi:hypothetical protein
LEKLVLQKKATYGGSKLKANTQLQSQLRKKLTYVSKEASQSKFFQQRTTFFSPSAAKKEEEARAQSQPVEKHVKRKDPFKIEEEFEEDDEFDEEDNIEEEKQDQTQPSKKSSSSSDRLSAKKHTETSQFSRGADFQQSEIMERNRESVVDDQDPDEGISLRQIGLLHPQKK